MLKNFAYVRATSVDEAVEQLRAAGGRVHAGGTDLIGCLRDGVFDAERVVSIAALEALKGIREQSGGGLRSGALTRVAEVAASPVIAERYAALARAASEVGTPQLRNQGTLGGNICQKTRCAYYRGPFPCRRKGGTHCFAEVGNNEAHAIFGGGRCYMVHPSDTAPALIALNASVAVQGPRGSRTVPLDKFFVLPSVDPTRETVLEQGEVVTEVLLPPPGTGLRSSYRKVRSRRSWDFALVGVALALRKDSGGTVSEARVVFSGVAPAPWRSAATEGVITGQRLTEDVVRRAAEAAVEEADPMPDNFYKVDLLQGIVAQELAAMA
ncbi:MAG: xanthine dehydrogenase family protein subunit M [Gemmatimonadetes bacterium]|nr:xanthine dehydrogenase family protein subunit M [Gemmatimonadota bacterium]